MSASFTLKVLFPLLLFNFALEPALASDYSDGVDLFGKQKYREAAQLFEKAMQSKQIDANLCYYCAVSQQFSKNNARAKQMYQYVLSRFPGTQQATLAQKALDGYTKSAPRTSEASTAGDTTTDSVASAAKTGSNAPKTNFSSRETTGLIKIIKPLADRPAVDDSFAASVQEQLKNLPLPLIHLFREHGLKLCVTPTAIDYDPKMADKHPRGYENGRTFRNVPALW